MERTRADGGADSGGRIIERDRTISVNNPAAIRAWQRARHWIGWISPPSVVAYRERDSINIFDSGKAAFNRFWLLTPLSRSAQARQIGWRSSPPVVPTGFARMPAGGGGSAGALGGTGTTIALRTAHRQEAIALVRFQLRALMEAGEKDSGLGGRVRVEFPDPLVVGIVARPAVEAGNNYKQVTKAYFGAVHAGFQAGRPNARDWMGR